MANELKIFENQEFGKVRVVMQDGELWFVAADVCKALGLSQVSMAMSKLEADEGRLIELTHPQSPSKTIAMNAVNEPGLYRLVLTSRKPAAKQFKRWITHEVVPSIRKNGGYIAGQEQMTDAELIAKALVAANNIIAEREKRIADMTAKIEEQSAAMTVMRPKAKYCDDVLQSKSLLNVETIAKEFGKTARWLNQYLHDKGIQFRRGKNAPWTLYQEYAGKGYARYDTYTDTRYRFSSENLKWTQEGRKFIHELLAQDGFEVVCSHE